MGNTPKEIFDNMEHEWQKLTLWLERERDRLDGLSKAEGRNPDKQRYEAERARTLKNVLEAMRDIKFGHNGYRYR